MFFGSRDRNKIDARNTRTRKKAQFEELLAREQALKDEVRSLNTVLSGAATLLLLV